MKTTTVLCPDPQADRLAAVADLIALALIRAYTSLPVDAGAPGSVYADMRRTSQGDRS